MANKKKKNKLADLRHPEYTAMVALWEKWQLCYEGSDAFRKAYLERYSKREDDQDYERRLKLTYIPGHARSAINTIRNALAVQLPDVVRTGSEDYVTAMATDVDTFQNAMTSYVATTIAPALLVQGRTFVVVDAPQEVEGATKADDDGKPYLFIVTADDMLSWARDNNGHINVALMRLWEDIIDEDTGLVADSMQIFRYYKRLETGDSFKGKNLEVVGPGVVVWDVDAKSNEVRPPILIPIDRVPIAEFRAVDSLMSEIADHQISALNIASTIVDFLWRSNFPIYVQMQASASTAIKPIGTRGQDVDEFADETTGTIGEPGSGKNDRQRPVGTGKGIGYPEGAERPAFISPETSNVEASMKELDRIATEIRVLVNLSLTSLSVKALEQSGASKEADRVGEEAGLAYLGSILESGERDIARLWAMFEGGNPDATDVKYPQSYSLKSDEERQQEAANLRALHSSVRSNEFQKLIDKRVADILLRPITTPEELEVVLKEIDANEFIDDDKTRAEIIGKDSVLRLVSNDTASKLRGYEDGEAAKAAEEDRQKVAELVGTAGGGTQ